jgi:hypothetical protein
MVASYVRERERIFLRWLENVERLLNRPVDRDQRQREATTESCPIDFSPTASRPRERRL